MPERQARQRWWDRRGVFPTILVVSCFGAVVDGPGKLGSWIAWALICGCATFVVLALRVRIDDTPQRWWQSRAVFPTIFLVMCFGAVVDGPGKLGSWIAWALICGCAAFVVLALRTRID